MDDAERAAALAKIRAARLRGFVSSPEMVRRAVIAESNLAGIDARPYLRRDDVAVWREPEGYKRLGKGARVRTTQDAERKDWASPRRTKWGVEGTVVDHHDSHGLCYDVVHQDGSFCCYDPDEIEQLPDRYEAWQGEGELTFTLACRIPELRETGQIGQDAVRVFEVEAETWEDAMAAYHRHMGWDPYKPMGPEDAGVVPK